MAAKISDVVRRALAGPVGTNGSGAVASPVEAARQAHATTTARIAALEADRQAHLLAGDEPAVDAADDELVVLRRTEARQGERIRLLDAESAAQAVEAEARRREAALDRIEQRLAEADAVGGELQEAIGRCDELFRHVIELRSEVRLAFVGGDAHVTAAASNPGGMALSESAVSSLVAHELFRIGRRVLSTGGDGMVAEASFPGPSAPDLATAAWPEKIVPLADRLKQASAFAMSLLRARPGSIQDVTEPAPPAMAPVAERAAAPPPPAAAVAPPAPLPAPDAAWVASLGSRSMSELLTLQMRSADDISPLGEARYAAIIAALENAHHA